MKSDLTESECDLAGKFGCKKRICQLDYIVNIAAVNLISL